MQLYTRTGDHGMTGTLVGRVSKSSTQVAALGALDTLHAHLAVVFEESFRTQMNALALDRYIKTYLVDVMHDLLDLGTHVSALTPVREGWYFGCVTIMTIKDPKYIFEAGYMSIEAMEAAIDAMCNATPELKTFILHTGSSLTAYAHLARTSCRAAEAAVVAFLGEAGNVELRDQLLLRYLNRLSDYLFALARLCTHVQEGAETVH